MAVTVTVSNIADNANTSPGVSTSTSIIQSENGNIILKISQSKENTSPHRVEISYPDWLRLCKTFSV